MFLLTWLEPAFHLWSTHCKCFQYKVNPQFIHQMINDFARPAKEAKIKFAVRKMSTQSLLQPKWTKNTERRRERERERERENKKACQLLTLNCRLNYVFFIVDQKEGQITARVDNLFRQMLYASFLVSHKGCCFYWCKVN